MVFDILENKDTKNVTTKYFNIFIVALILLNIIAFFLELIMNTTSYKVFLRTFEIFSITIFTVEYVLRIWSCTLDKKYQNSIQGRVKFAFTPLAILDLLVLLPFYLTAIPLDLRVLRAVRLFRILRILKFSTYYRKI